MKGQQPIEWVFIVTALTLIFVVFAINPLQAGIDEAIQGNAQLQAQRLASAINMISTAPPGTTYNFYMPDTKCTVTITDGLVRMRTNPVIGKDIEYSVGIIKTPVTITKGTFDCKNNKIIKLTKSGNFLQITTR